MLVAKTRSFPRLALALAGTALLVAAAACGDSDTTVSEDGLPFDQFPEAYRQAQCDHIVACGLMPDLATCLSASNPDAVVVQATAAVAWGDVTYDPKAGQSCVDAIRTASCEAGTLYPRELREACDAVFGNRKGNGEPCFAAIECQGLDAVCEGACGDGCCAGTCKVQGGLAKEGEVCSADLPCDATTTCLPDPMAMDGTTICVKPAGPNEVCGSNGCVAGYACDPGTSKCFKQGTSGAQCNPALANSCASPAEYCNQDAKKCTVRPKVGEACGTTPIEANICARYAHCDTDSKCHLSPGPGDPCFGGVCLGDYSCNIDVDPAVCQPLVPARACVNLQ